jgi:2-methylcitrate dehydratase PrpD
MSKPTGCAADIMKKNLRQSFSEFIVNTRFSDLPKEVVDQTKRCILDFVGVALAGSKVGLAPIITGIVCNNGGTQEATLVGDGTKVPASSAALVNSIKGHTLDMDDGHRYAGAHPGIVVIPAALAIGELKNVNGTDLIESIVVGYETFIRIASSINPHHAQQGFHTTGTVGTFGAVAACSKLLRLDRKHVGNALAIAGLQGAGLLEVAASGQMMKPLHPGRASQAGVLAALLAKEGAEGPDLIFEGEKGFFRAFSTFNNPNKVTENLGSKFEIMNTYFKLHATCRASHPSIDAVMQICMNHKLGPNDILEIEIKTFPHAINLCGKITHPDNILAAKFSIPYSVAMAIYLGDLSADKFTDKNIRDEKIKNLASKVKVHVSEEWVACYPEKRGATATIKTKTGDSYSFSLPLAKGAPENPATIDELMEKFVNNSTATISLEKAKTLIVNIADLEKVSTSDITNLLF